MTPTSLAAYLALFSAAACGFLFVHLVIGRLLRPNLPNVEKQEVYECGEPAIGSSFVQFDLRFYVVALLFIIFDVEVAFFFPWATVFGKATHLMDPNVPKVVAAAGPGETTLVLSADANNKFEEMGVPASARPVPDQAKSPLENDRAIEHFAGRIAWFSLGDIGVFFAVLLAGFAYVWSRGDLDWVRAVQRERALEPSSRGDLVEAETEAVLSA